MKANILILLSVLLLIAALSIGTKLHAGPCIYKRDWNDCEIDPPFPCIPNERDWAMFGNSYWDTCVCASGTALEYCEQKEGAGWCMYWYDCDSQCTTCDFNEDSSFHLLWCDTSGP